MGFKTALKFALPVQPWMGGQRPRHEGKGRSRNVKAYPDLLVDVTDNGSDTPAVLLMTATADTIPANSFCRLSHTFFAKVHIEQQP